MSEDGPSPSAEGREGADEAGTLHGAVVTGVAVGEPGDAVVEVVAWWVGLAEENVLDGGCGDDVEGEEGEEGTWEVHGGWVVGLFGCRGMIDV